MKHRHNRLAVVLALAGVITVAPVFTAAAERQTGGTTTQRGTTTQPAPAAPPAPAAAATPKTPASPPMLPALALQIKLGCYVLPGAGGFGGPGNTVIVTNTTSKTLPAGQKISWRKISSKGWGNKSIYTLLFSLQPGAEKAVGKLPSNIKELDCEALVGG